MPLAHRYPAVRSRIEAAGPAPSKRLERDAGLYRDRSDIEVIKKDVPTVGALGVSAAGEGGRLGFKANAAPPRKSGKRKYNEAHHD
jgi:hypothetical protein